MKGKCFTESSLEAQLIKNKLCWLVLLGKEDSNCGVCMHIWGVHTQNLIGVSCLQGWEEEDRNTYN